MPKNDAFLPKCLKMQSKNELKQQKMRVGLIYFG